MSDSILNATLLQNSLNIVRLLTESAQAILNSPAGSEASYLAYQHKLMRLIESGAKLVAVCPKDRDAEVESVATLDLDEPPIPIMSSSLILDNENESVTSDAGFDLFRSLSNFN